MANLMRKMRYLTKRLLYLTTADVEERFFRFLVDQYGERDEYEVDLSKKDMAAAIDALPETFSRLLLKLKDEGTIAWDASVLRVRRGFWRERTAGDSA